MWAKSKYFKLTITLIIFIIFILFILWIIYFFINKDSSSNIREDSFINEVYVDNFSKKTDSYLYAVDGTDWYYDYLDYETQDFVLSIPRLSNYNFFQSYYVDNQVAFTWCKKEQADVYFYKIEDRVDLNQAKNENLDPIGSSEQEYNSINHEYLYIPEYNYIFAINNIYGARGRDSNNNGGLGDPSIQQIIFIDCNTGEFEFINIGELLNYQPDSWYYIDQNNDYYRTIMPSNDLFHFNSIDFDGENIYANSRTLGAIISIKIFDDAGNFIKNPEVNWIYSNNYATYYYYYYSEDLNGNYPIIYADNLNHYITNPEYDPQETYDFHKNNDGLQDKFINWNIDGVYYSANNLETLKNVQKENEETLFMGEHCVKLLNPYIEKLGPDIFFEDPNYYDSNNLYFSMFDNHAENNATSLEIHEDSEESDYPKFEEDPNSYIKIIEINPTNSISKNGLESMTGRTILNYPVEQKSEVVSSCYFFNENNLNYVAIDQGYRDPEDEIENRARMSIYQFDKINPKTSDFTSVNLVYDASFNVNYVYRAYPVWINLNNVIVSWNL